MPKKLEKYREIERSVITTYRKVLWSPFVLAVKKYRLIAEGDKIAVCISGGKDSMLLAKLMQELHRHSEVNFDLVFLVMDPGYNEANRRKIEENAARSRADFPNGYFCRVGSGGRGLPLLSLRAHAQRSPVRKGEGTRL